MQAEWDYIFFQKGVYTDSSRNPDDYPKCGELDYNCVDDEE